MKRTMLLSLAFLLGAAARTAPPPDYAVYSVEDAIAYWTRLCVATMPDRRAFAGAFAADPGWVQFRKREGGHPVLGLFWRSSRGELSYMDHPLPTETNQGCHYTFRTTAGVGHADAARALVSALGREVGRTAESAREPQTHWEATLPNGTRVRIFLNSGVPNMGGAAARLSISAYRDARPNR